MGLRELGLKTSYETEEGNTQLIDEFYVPALENSTKYYRIAGFFSSSSLVVAAKGIEGLINNDGKMYLLVSPELSDEDYATISEHNKLNETMDLFSDLDLEGLPHENLQALAWLLDNGRLEIKIVVGQKSKKSLFHQKVGILFDESGDMLSFSGSINETAQAWLNNIEEFKVFKSWETGQEEYLQSDLEKFLAYWKNERPEIAKVYDIPEAIQEQIVKIKPRDVWDLNIMRRYRKETKARENKLDPFPHQKKAIEMWFANDKRLLMEMATGTGKTRTAIGCLNEKLKDKEKLLTIVATPQITLSQQWNADFDELEIVVDKRITVPGTYTSAGWKKELELLLLDFSDDKVQNAVVFTTHTTASSADFISIIKNNKFDTKILFICDECHAIGSFQNRKAMLDEYEYRIGLSATPERMFDEGGTANIRSYFGGKSFEFDISEALHTNNPLTGEPFLNRFYYKPIFVYLTPAETTKYANYSRQIALLLQDEDHDEQDLERLYDKRAQVGKNADNKFLAFDSLLDDMGPASIQDTIVFVSDKQISRCFDIMSNKKIKRAKITESESADRIINEEGESERQSLINQFKRRQLQVLVGMKCLDEGIDIKNARIAILMSNSTNPREYVQRVGRVIRWEKNKPESVIFDFIVVPDEHTNGGAGLLEKEARRAYQIAVNAINYDAVYDEFKEKGVCLDADK